MQTLPFLKKYPVLIGFCLIFIISWGLIIILAGPLNLPINPEESEKILPLLYVMMLFGPGITGILLTGLDQGKAGLIDLKNLLIKWRVGFRYYLLALFGTPVIALLILFVLSIFSNDFYPGILGDESNVGMVFIGLFTGLMVGLFEEIGWSGYIIPRLRQGYNLFYTGLIVGLVWGAWHFILFWEMDSFSMTIPFLILMGRLFAWLPPFRIFMIWILERTKSLLPVILTHASLVFTTTVIVPMSLSGNNLLIWLLLWGVALWVPVLVLAVVKGGIFSGNQKAMD